MTQLRIRQLATERGYNISTLTRKTALAYTTVHSLWHDSAQVWNRHSLDRIAQALDVRVPDLMAGEPGEDDGKR